MENIPQIILIVLCGLDVLYCTIKDGEPKEGNVSVANTVLQWALVLGVVIWGGFFN